MSMSTLAGTAAGDLIAHWVPVKNGMCSSQVFLILIRITFTDLTLTHRGLSPGQEWVLKALAAFSGAPAFSSPLNVIVIGAFSWL